MMVWSLVQHALIITTFVAVMMVAIEYVNVLSQGWWLRAVGRSRWTGYLVGVVLGAMPGCLGAFALVTLFIARRVTLGAVVAGMIATSGDEMFVMLAMFPGTAIAITGGLVVVGLVAGMITDLVLPASGRSCCTTGLAVHDSEATDCACFDPRTWLSQWHEPTPHRVVLGMAATGFLAALGAGAIGPSVLDWRWVTLMVVVSFGLFVVLTAPDHFLDEHLWKHVATRHVPRIFAWTLGALVAVEGLDRLVNVESFVRSNSLFMLVLASVVGIIPESGPHLVFVTLYDQGALPLGVLVASSVVQDGHGMLPLLAHSRSDFLKVKAVNLIVGLLVGSAILVAIRLL